MPTIFRSKTSELVEQELYAILIAYNLLRDLMYQSANEYGKNPLLLSFLESLQLVIDLVHFISHVSSQFREIQHQYLLSLISQSKYIAHDASALIPVLSKLKCLNSSAKTPPINLKS